MSRLRACALGVIGMGLITCGSDGRPGLEGSTGLDASRKLTTLTQDEIDTLCDWVLEGSDGKICVDGKATKTLNRTGCVNDLALPAECTATVHDVEGCWSYIAKDCTGWEESAFEAACDAFAACVGAVPLPL